MPIIAHAATNLMYRPQLVHCESLDICQHYADVQVSAPTHPVKHTSYMVYPATLRTCTLHLDRSAWFFELTLTR